MKSIHILFISLVLLHFFGLFQISYLNYVISLGLVANFVNVAWAEGKVQKSFNISLSIVLIGLVCSALSSLFFEQTSLWDSFVASQFIISIFYFTFLLKMDVDRKDVERVLVILALVMCSFYILEYISVQLGMSWVKTRDALSEQGENVRLRMEGSALSAFAFFYGLCKILNNEGRRAFNYTLMFLGGFVILLMAFRTMVVGLLLVSLFLIVKVQGLNFSLIRNVLIGGIALLAVSTFSIVQSKVDYMSNKISGTEVLSNDNYVRWINLGYHYAGYFKNGVEMFFGSGITATEGTAYRAKLDFTSDNHLRYVDWGLLGLSWMIGVIAVAGMLWYSFKIIRIKTKKSDSYITAFYIYLLLVSVLTNEFSRQGNFVIQALVMYLAYTLMEEGKDDNELVIISEIEEDDEIIEIIDEE